MIGLRFARRLRLSRCSKLAMPVLSARNSSKRRFFSNCRSSFLQTLVLSQFLTAIKPTMEAVVLTDHGKPLAKAICETPSSYDLPSHEVMIAVRSVGVNPLDIDVVR